MWPQPFEFLQSNSHSHFQVIFPGLISSLSDENMVCSFNIVKGAGEECLGFWHELGLIYPEIQAGTSVQRGVASCWEV